MMKKTCLVYLLVSMVLFSVGCSQSKVKRVGMVIGIRPEKIEQYKALHVDTNPGVRDLLTKYNLRNFSIFMHQIDGKWYEFGYYEYTGDDFEADMAKLDAEPRNQRSTRIAVINTSPIAEQDVVGKAARDGIAVGATEQGHR